MHGSHAAAGFAAYDTMRRAEAYSRHPLEAQDSLVLHNSLAASPASVALEHQVINQWELWQQSLRLLFNNKYVTNTVIKILKI